VNSLLVYPNPANEVIRIVLDGQMEGVLITNITGKTILDVNDPGSAIALNIAALQPGIYVVRAIAGKKHYVGKFIKQ
jgi:hypothetical protein